MRNYRDMVKLCCRVEGTRMNAILSAIEEGASDEDLRRLCDGWSRTRGGALMDDEEAGYTFGAYRKVLEGTISKGPLDKEDEEV